MSKADGWIGVDFDGTLAHHAPGAACFPLGEPILPMVRRVTAWLAQGIEVRIVTARAGTGPTENSTEGLEAWCLKHIGMVLPITCSKDFGMIELWDDRAVQVIPNTGQRADGLA